MIRSLPVPNPMAALMLTPLDIDGSGRVRSGRRDLRRRQRRYQRRSKLRKLLA